MIKKISLAEDTITQDELDCLAEWVRSGERLTKGPLCSEFERVFADYLGSRYAVFVNSGSSANLVMIYALLEGGYLRNMNAIAPALSWVTTVTPLMQLGFDVQLCECDRRDLGIDPDHFEKMCRERRPALAIVVHVLGHAGKMESIQEICDRYDVTLIEDSCEALGSIYKGKKLGSMSKAGAFSFYYGHHISTIEGGMVVTDDERLYNLMLSIRSHGWGRDVEKKYHDQWTQDYQIDEIRDLYTFYYPGFNLRSTDLNAFLGLSQIKKIDRLVKKRRENYQLYSEMLKDFWCQRSDTEFISSFAYGVIVRNRLEVYKHLNANHIESRPLICGNIGRHPFWINKYGEAGFTVADIVHDYGLYLPNHFGIGGEEIKYITDTFKDVAQSFGKDLNG